MIGLDTNVVVRLFSDDDEEQYRSVLSLLETLSKERPGFISQPVLVEMYWVLRFTYKLSRDQCLTAVRTLVESEEIEFDDGECVVEALIAAEDGADFADALIQTNSRQFQVSETVTFDQHAAKHLGWRVL